MPFIRDHIDEGYYVHVMANEYFLPHTPYYRKIHNLHAILVFGYDDRSEMLETLGFDRARNYSVSPVTFANFEGAFRWIDPTRPRSSQVELFEYNRKGEYEFNISTVIDQLHAYVYSVNSSKPYQMLRKPIDAAFGMATYGLLKDYFANLMNHFKSWDRRHLYTLWEHKKCMLARLVYMEDIGHLDLMDGYSKAYKEVEQKARCAHLMMLKTRALYEIKRKRDIDLVERIILMIEDIALAERRILTNVLSAL